MSPEVLKLNQIAQGFIPWPEGLAWFRGLDAAAKAGVLRDLAGIAQQSHPRTDEVEPAMALAALKPTFTPCVLVRQAGMPPEKVFVRLLALPENEWEKVFLLLLALLSVADARRRNTDCVDGCAHDWHHIARP